MNKSPLYPPALQRDKSFVDLNLKLPILDELLGNGLLNLGEPDELVSHVLKKKIDLESDGWDLIEPALEYLRKYPLSQSLLDQVYRLEFDGCLAIYRYAFYHWGGESHEFDVTSLSGIEKCRNLKRINVISMLTCEDLEPIGKLHNLEEIELSGDGEWRNLQCLLDLPRLRKVRFFSNEINDSDKWVLQELLKRGIDSRSYE